MNDSEEYRELEEDEKKIKEKLKEGIPSDEAAELHSELNTIGRRKTKLRNRM